MSQVVTKTKPVWQTPSFTKAAARVEESRKLVIDDPRTPYHGTRQSFSQNGISGWYKRETLYRATLTDLEGGATQVEEASSNQELWAKILQHQQIALANSHQLSIDPDPRLTNNVFQPVVRWIAEFTTPDGDSGRAAAATLDELMITILNWRADDLAALREIEEAQAPAPVVHYDWATICDGAQKVQLQMFVDRVPEYRPTFRNFFKLEDWLKRNKKEWICENLIAAFDELFDAGELDGHGQPIDEALENDCRIQVEGKQ